MRRHAEHRASGTRTINVTTRDFGSETGTSGPSSPLSRVAHKGTGGNQAGLALRSLERPPTWDELIKDHEEWRCICSVDQYLQEPGEHEGELSTRNPEERPYFVRAHECWYPHSVRNIDIVRRLLDRCHAYFPPFHNLAEANPVWIEGWTGLTVFLDAGLKDRLEFYGLPRELRECGEVNCRELKKISSAPTPEEMRNKEERELLAARLLDVHATQLDEKDMRSRFTLAPFFAQERLASGCREPTLPLSARIKPPLAARLSSPVPRTAPPQQPLAKRIGPLVEQAPPADAMEWEAADGSAWSGSGVSVADPSRDTEATAANPPAQRGRGREAARTRGHRASSTYAPLGPSARRRSASPPRAGSSARGAPSVSSSSSAAFAAPARPIEPGKDGLIALPNPADRLVKIARFDSAEWRAGLRQLEYELEAIRVKTSPEACLPEIRRKFESLHWSPTLMRYGYVKVKMHCDQVRLWAWGADKRVHYYNHDVLCRLLATGRPMRFCLPESMLPRIAPPEARGVKNTDHEVLPLTMTREMTLKKLSKLYKSGLGSLANRAHAGAFAGLGGAASFVVRRFMWDEVADRIGAGPSRETTISHGGKRGQVSDGTTVYYDFGDDCERTFIEGKVLYPADNERNAGVRHYFPPYQIYFAETRETHGEWSEWDEDYCQNIADAIENGTAEPKTEAEWRKILGRDRMRALEHKQMAHVFLNRLTGKEARVWARHLAEIHRLEVGEYRRINTLLDSLEPRFLLKA
ncbi:uncharacterized protein SCHCODRAFT_02729032 [Schizophyllum commune H4-8]|uniref:Uncharacterized protein n=1 Tax=Schizophyllum commune (strain H4-8 / FGSC 9210) TaxID=578458 RepID=D8QI00_SCHCM|nr:uncharacterized protein SCHCODRAFT_02729032 [Schizophyllum commune H4-8]KAI5895906.1 hypothetical protein SCHCODRAFT_02729032 [Schizophyllum commune H4-8]